MKSVKSPRAMKFKRLTSLATGMDTAIVLPVMGAAAAVMLIVALALAPHNADDFTEAATAQADSATVDGSGVPAVAVARNVEPAAQTQPQVATPATVTISGCLERDDETFRLKDTSGADAPRSRSWKSGFLKKGSAQVEVVDASNRLKLTNHVGQRVSVTGTLNDGEMQIRSLRRIAASCKDTNSGTTV